MTTVLELRDKVRRIISEDIGSLDIDADGDLSFRVDSARVFIRCVEQELKGGGSRTLIFVTAPTIWGAPATPQLWQYVATHADDWLFGHMFAKLDDQGAVNIFISHCLLGDYLDPEELKAAVYGVVGAADGIDDEIKAQFGGVRFHEA